MLSGMCVPDILGTQGSFTHYSTKEGEAKLSGGRGIKLEIENEETFSSYIPGPPDPYFQNRQLRVPFKGKVKKNHQEVSLFLPDKQIQIKIGEYTDLVRITYRTKLGKRIKGLVKFYLKKLNGRIDLYLSPVNIDPANPVMPISHPATYAPCLANLLGEYATLGLAEDTSALNEGVIAEDAFLEQVYSHHQEREKMLFSALENLHSGLVVCVFDTPDRIQHMFFRYLPE